MNRVAEYKKLNEIALPLGVVIFGEGKDTEIPASEIKASFELDYPVYNRSFSDLNLDNAFSLYCECISMLLPDAVFLHLGENDKELFDSDETSFELKYLELLKKIKLLNRKTRIIVISVDNERINKRLKYIADSAKCEYGDISNMNAWNFKRTKSVLNFVQNIGAERFYKEKPVYDLMKILFCFV